MKSYPQRIVIEEQGLRDGLQSETPFLPTDKKLELIRAVADAGLKRIQVTAFVHPKLVPQMMGSRFLSTSSAKNTGKSFAKHLIAVTG
ncbi:MAG: hypothetical protein JRE12_00835 [Deltaproteobacteria bacterium]|nr:hypothetical protein [Deltaproteobacteria bacterium]